MLQARASENTEEAQRQRDKKMVAMDGPSGGRHDLEKQLRELAASEARYRTLLNNMPAAVLQVDASHMAPIFQKMRQDDVVDIRRYLSDHPQLVDYANSSVMVKEVNDVALSLFGAADAAQVLGPVGFIFNDTPGAAEKVMEARFKGNTNLVQRLKTRTFDGRMIDTVMMVSYPQQATTFDRTILMIVDVTDQVRVENELKQMEAQFADFAKFSVLAELSGSIVHEVKQPLSVVLTDVATTLRWLSSEEPNIPKIRHLMGRIEESVHRANEVIQRVKELSRNSKPSLTECDINNLARDALAFVMQEGAKRSIKFTTYLDASNPIVRVDPVQIQQLVVNLLMNSLHAVEHGRSAGSISVTTSSDDKGVTIEVADSGPGIPDEASLDIFKSFVTTKENGMGMGLSICRAIARAHGGDVSASNSTTGGAVFRVRLPNSA